RGSPASTSSSWKRGPLRSHRRRDHTHREGPRRVGGEVAAVNDLLALCAFYREHQYCGEPVTGLEDDRVWMTCTCGADDRLGRSMTKGRGRLPSPRGGASPEVSRRACDRCRAAPRAAPRTTRAR